MGCTVLSVTAVPALFVCLAFTPDAGLLTSREIWSTIKWNFRLDLRLGETGS